MKDSKYPLHFNAIFLNSSAPEYAIKNTPSWVVKGLGKLRRVESFYRDLLTQLKLKSHYSIILTKWSLINILDAITWCFDWPLIKHARGHGRPPGFQFTISNLIIVSGRQKSTENVKAEIHFLTINNH